MNQLFPNHDNPLSDDPTETRLGEEWDSAEIVRLVRSNSTSGFMPSLLMLGKRETSLLRSHLAKAFNEEELAQLTEFHYIGLKVIETQLDSLVKVAGEQMSSELKRASRHLPVWKETNASRWSYDARME